MVMTLKKRIVIVALNDILNDPRVQRAAKIGVEGGYDVVVIGLVTPRSTPKEMKDGYKILRFDQRSPFTYWFDEKILKFFKKFSNNKNTQDTIKEDVERQESEEDSGYLDYVIELNHILAKKAMDLKPDIIHCNDLDTLLCGKIVKEKTGCKLIYDVHELFCDQQFPRSQKWLNYFRDLEKNAMPFVDRTITVSSMIAVELTKRYQIELPYVIYNCPYSIDYKIENETSPLSLYEDRVKILYQGRFEKDRGLEEMIIGMKKVNGAVLLLRGFGPLGKKLEQIVKGENLQQKVVFLDPVPMNQMVKEAAFADIGIISYRPTCLNNLYSAPNKLFEYMMAGLAVAASNLPEISQIVQKNEVGLNFNPEDIDEISDILNQMVENKEMLNKFKKNSLNAAAKLFTWNVVGRKLLEIYKGVLA